MCTYLVGVLPHKSKRRITENKKSKFCIFQIETQLLCYIFRKSMAIEIVTYNLWSFVFFLSWNGRFHPSTVCYATWRRRRSTSSSISIRTSTPLFRRRTRSTTNSECSTGSRSGREPTPTPGNKQNKLENWIFIESTLFFLSKWSGIPMATALDWV